MDIESSRLSDSELLAKFKRCSPKTGERLVLFAELKKRNLLAAFNGENPLLFKGTAPLGGTESIFVLVGAAIICTICIQFKATPWLVFLVFTLILICLLDGLNVIVYRSIFIYPNGISVATCLCSDKLQLKKKTIQFSEQGLYLNSYYEKPLIHRFITPEQALFILRPIPSVTPVLRCFLPFKTINQLLNQLIVFFESIGQNVFIESSSREIPLSEAQPSTDLKAFCLRQGNAINHADFTNADINWLRLIAMACGKNIPKEIQSHPLAVMPGWLEPGERLIICLNTWIGFRKKGYMFFTSHRAVWTNLSGDYIDGTPCNINLLLRPKTYDSAWWITFNNNSTLQTATSPYPIPAILVFLQNGGYEK